MFVSFNVILPLFVFDNVFLNSLEPPNIAVLPLFTIDVPNIFVPSTVNVAVPDTDILLPSAASSVNVTSVKLILPALAKIAFCSFDVNTTFLIFAVAAELYISITDALCLVVG